MVPVECLQAIYPGLLTCVLEVKSPSTFHFQKSIAELCSVLCDSLDGRGICGRMDTYICMAKSLCYSPETITTLLMNIPYYKKKRVCGTCPWKWPSDCQVNVCQASWKPCAREVEASTLWKRARCAKGHSSWEQKGSGKWFSLWFHLSRCWTCADAKQHPITGSQPWQLPQRDTSPGIKAVLRETDWRPRSLVLHFWIVRQITFLKGSKSRWSFWTHVKPGNK